MKSWHTMHRRKKRREYATSEHAQRLFRWLAEQRAAREYYERTVLWPIWKGLAERSIEVENGRE